MATALPRIEPEVDTLVVGAGVLGSCIAYRLAQKGVDVLAIDRLDLNREASGTNAGSLHVQINSHFAAVTDETTVRGIDGAVPLHVEATRTWRRLSEELDCDIEYEVSGGLMVAESEREGFLNAIIERERRLGVPAELVTGRALRGLAPYLGDSIVAAAFCPIEGKVNPIIATPAIARAAARAGARFAFYADLLGLDRTEHGFLARTSRGHVRCRMVVNAAGVGAANVAALVGLSLPVEPRPLHMNVTEPADYFLPHLVQHAGQRLTVKQARRGNVIIGGGWPGVPGDRGITVLRASIEGNLRVAQQVVPRVSRLDLLRTWGANIYRVPDISPVLGPTRHCPGFLVAVAVPNGYTLAPVCAEIVTEFAVGRLHSLYHDGFSPDRFAPDAKHVVD